jgi:uncharacterized protein (TIGR02217 family)
MADYGWAADDMFIDKRFPLALSTNATFTLENQVLITRMDSGRESRQARWSSPLRRYTVRSARTLQEMETLRDFWSAAGGPFRSFRFKDFTDYTSSSWSSDTSTPDAIGFDDQNIGTGDGSTTAFQLRKQYTVTDDDNVAWTTNRPITKPILSTVSIGIGGVQQTNSGSPSLWHVNPDTGMVYFATAPGNGLAITAGYEYDVHVRFDGDVLASTLVSSFELESPGIQLVELRNA